MIAGQRMNTWTWDLDAPGLPPGDYDLMIGQAKTNITGSFTVKNPASLSSTPVKPTADMKPPLDDYTFPIFVACTLIVLAIVLYYAGRE